MGKQSEQRHTIALNEPSGELPEELRTLVEKRAQHDRRVKDRRGGPPRRSLSDSTSAGDDHPERRKASRRTAGTRRRKPRRD